MSDHPKKDLTHPEGSKEDSMIPDIVQLRKEAKKIAFGLTRGQLMTVIYIIWITIGTAYYAAGSMDLGFCKGYYMCVNVGYSIGWGYPTETEDSQYFFGTYHVIVGASLVGVAIGFFGDQAMADSNSWSKDVEEKAQYNKIMSFSGNYWLKLTTFITFNWVKVRIVLLWCLFALFGTLLMVCQYGWTFWAGLYFAVSSMSTGGLKPIPRDAEDADYFVVGLFSAIGVPLMGLAMGTIGQSLMGHDTMEDVEAVLNSPISKVELDDMKAIHGIGFEREINKHEFILLSAVRLGYLDPDAISHMCRKYDSFKRDNSGQLTYDDLVKDTSQKTVAMNPINNA